MTAPSPKLRIEGACERLGRAEVIRRSVTLLAGGDEDAEFIVTLGGAPAVLLLADGVPDGQAYWLRVWAARGLLWAGPDDNTEAIRRALRDDHWRVREMICKVVARYRVGDVLDEVAALESDRINRVRRAAQSAVRRIVEAAA